VTEFRLGSKLKGGQNWVYLGVIFIMLILFNIEKVSGGYLSISFIHYPNHTGSYLVATATTVSEVGVLAILVGVILPSVAGGMLEY
jgi:hypothetical protein